jgi:hypothetical protein
MTLPRRLPLRINVKHPQFPRLRQSIGVFNVAPAGRAGVILARPMQRRSFHQPFTNAVQIIGPGTIWGTLFGGPFYYWKKGALIEGTIMGVLAVMPWFVDPNTALISPDIIDNASWIVWGVFVFLSPALLAWSYRRRGWVEQHDA